MTTIQYSKKQQAAPPPNPSPIGRGVECEIPLKPPPAPPKEGSAGNNLLRDNLILVSDKTFLGLSVLDKIDLNL